MSVVSRFVPFFACAGVLVAAGFSPAIAADKSAPTLLGTAKYWSAYSRTTPDGKVCYALAKASSSTPKNAKRDQAYLLINAWPGRKVSAEVQMVPGYMYKTDAPVSATVGKLTIDFFSKNDGGAGAAWVKNVADEDRLLTALRKGSRVTVSGTPKSGSQTKDTFLLGGMGDMIDKAQKACTK